MRKQGNLPRSQGLVDERAISRVQVYVRIRPLGQSDVRNAERKGAVNVEDEDVSQLHVVDGKKEKKFQFDHVLSPDSTNEEVYQVVGKPLVEASMTGLNSILMAYGQTGAGKTHTLMAPDGLTTSVVSHVFRLISKDSAHSYAVSCSYLQIYQERVYDLLAPDKSGPEVFLREHPKKGVYVENLSEYFVKSPEEIGRLLKSGKKKLAIAETKMNRQSSRSHAVCLLKIERLSVPRRYGGIADSSSSYESSYMSGTSDTEFSSDSGSMEAFGSYQCSEDDELLERITTQTRGLAAIRGKLYVCDLAGSERVKKTKAEGERLQEAQSINSSLLALGNVIQALAEGKKRHIPYRNSTLTRLLQDGLDGNSKTSLIVCVSPSVRDVNETLCSLKFGLRAMKVHNVTHVNVEVDYEKMAKQLSESLEGKAYIRHLCSRDRCRSPDFTIKEREWRRQKSEYESYIMALEAERDSRSKHETEKQLLSSSRETTEKTHFPVTLEEVALKNQTKAVLLAELVSMELFYGLEDLLRIGDTGLAEGLTSSKLYNLTDKDLLLHSAETLLELTEYFFAKSTLSEEDSGRNPALKKLDSEGKTERPSRLLAQGHGELLGGVSKGESSYERKLFRVRETLCRLKRTTDSASLGFLSRLLDAKFDESEKGLQEYKKRLYELLKHLVETQTSCSGVETTEEIDPLKLEQSLCHVLMDKALLNCLLLLDKADMESRIKTLDVQTFDYTGLSSATPVQCDCSSQSSDDFGPSSPVSGARNLDVRLTSVDEGVVLESSSESANSREKLAAHLENTMEELEGENKRLYEKNEELRKRCEQSENENSELSIKLVEYETKLERSERKLSLSGKTRLENTAVEVQDKMEEREFEACVLSLRMEDLEYKLKTKDKTISVLKQNEKMLRGQLFEQRKRTEDVEEQNAKLQLKVKQAEEKFEQSELKLASYTGSEMLESRKITKQLESLIVENKELALKVLKLEEEKSKVRDQNDGENKADFSEDQKKMLEKKIINLEVKLKDQEVKILSVKEYERRIRAELCKEMTKKLTKAQTQTRQLGEKIFELESKLREAEQQYSTVRGMDTSARSAMRDGIKSLTDKLRAAECRNRELSGFVQDAEERLLLSQRKVLAAKQAEIDMREKVQLLELENCRIKERTNIRKEEKIIRPSTGRTADRLEKLRKENSNLSLELKCFRENILKLERDLLKKDEEILTLRNDSVDLSSEVCKLRSELDESNKCKNELKKKVTTCSEAEQKLVARLAIVQEELNKLETSKAMQVEQAANGDWSASSESTLLIGEINFEDPAKSVDSSTFLEETSNDEMVKESKMHDSDIGHELDGLQVVIDKLRLENLRVTEKNEILEREMKSLEENLSVVEKAFQACRSENECLLREVNLKSSKATTEGTHASFCTEKAGELRSEIGAQRQSEISLEKRLADLENESICMREEIGHGMLEFTELREKKGSLEKKVSEASLVVDHLKKEILDLINGLLTLQRNLNLYVDKMLACLGLEETSLQPFRVGLINGSSTPTEESSSDASSEISETFSWKSAFSFRLLPDKEGFLNPSDVSTIRESKAEIIRVHEDLKAKILAIKDALSRLPIHAGDENVEAESALDGKTNEFGANLLVDTSKSGSVLPRLCRAERVKLSSLLSRLKEELVRERKTSNDGRSEGNDLCTLYDNLESKLSRLSCELALREDEITILVTQRKKLQDELEECEKGLIICCHCASKIPNQIEENRQQLKGKLLSHIEDTSWLESEIWGFMEYRQKLESELDKIKGKVINMEDELDVRKILMKRCTSVGPEGDERDVSNSDSSKEDTDDFRPSLPGKKRKSQKHVTFENVDISESEDKLTNKRRRQKSDTVDNDQSGHARSSPDDWLEADMDSSDVDLCELLASIPRDIPKKPPSPEELEIAEIANRLSGYDNMSFDDKLQYATLSRKTEQDLEYTTDCKGVLSNGNNSHSKTTHDEVVEGDDAERITCQMCGLFRKRS